MSKRVDMVKAAQEMPRFDFVCTFVAWRTRTKAGRELSGGLQVKRAGTGWAVGMPLVGAWSEYADARLAFEHLRRTAACSFTQEAEDMRVWALS